MLKFKLSTLGLIFIASNLLAAGKTAFCNAATLENQVYAISIAH
jgi:hypothetical protein